MKVISATILLILGSVGTTFSQYLKSDTGHAGNPYYSNIDTKKLHVSDAEWIKTLLELPTGQIGKIFRFGARQAVLI